MDLKILVKEIDYQKEYSYEKRVDLMNKYAISTSQKYFNLIYELGKFIVGDRRISKSSYKEDNIFYGRHNSCYSHTGAVMSRFNNQSYNLKNHQATVRIDGNSILLYTTVYDSKLTKLKPFLSFDLEFKTFSIRDGAGSVKIRREVYREIDNWLVDFGFEKWNPKKE